MKSCCPLSFCVHLGKNAKMHVMKNCSLLPSHGHFENKKQVYAIIKISVGNLETTPQCMPLRKYIFLYHPLYILK